ncbi:MAG TPA: retropepsin-like aspartic protease [Acetobacteraceae bacterium]|nr:retropepsin-like aspartic protease [Acetobacteraceae bacterium]
MTTAMPMTVTQGRLYVPVTMNDVDGSFMLDTGAEFTLLGPDFAARAHAGIDVKAGRDNGRLQISGAGGRGTVTLNEAHVRETKIGGIAFPDWEYPVLPPSAASVMPGGRDGLLGMDFLHYFDLDLDFKAGTLKLWRLSGCTDIHPTWQGDYDSIPLKHTGHQGVTMPIFIDNAFLDVQFDTGAGSLLLSRDAAAAAGVTDAMLAADPPANNAGIGGGFPAVMHQFQLLLIGSRQFHKPVITVETERHRTGYGDGLLGLRFLQPTKIWLSYATNTLFMQYAGK